MKIDANSVFDALFSNTAGSRVSHAASGAVQRGLGHVKPIPGFANSEPPSADLLVRGQNACERTTLGLDNDGNWPNVGKHWKQVNH
jgi:hypothetical protein